MTYRQMCESISKSGLVTFKAQDRNHRLPTPMEIFNYSSKGELYMIPVWFNDVKAATNIWF